MLLQQMHQWPPTPQFPYHQYGSPYLSPSHPMMPVPHRTHQFTTPVRHSAESNTDVCDSQPLLVMKTNIMVFCDYNKTTCITWTCVTYYSESFPTEINSKFDAYIKSECLDVSNNYYVDVILNSATHERNESKYFIRTHLYLFFLTVIAWCSWSLRWLWYLLLIYHCPHQFSRNRFFILLTEVMWNKACIITKGRSSKLMSIFLFSAEKQALRCPKAHSITFLALHCIYLNYCSRSVLPPFAYSFITYGNSWYAGSPKIKTCIGS